MANNKRNRNQVPPYKSTTSNADQNAKRRRDSGKPGGGQGRTDVTGTMPGNVRIDPNITENHPGYEESGDSEIIPNDRLAAGRDNRG